MEQAIYKHTIKAIGLLLLAVLAVGCSDLGNNPASTDTSSTTDTAVTQPVSFRSDVTPIFNRYGCTSCHGGSGGLIVQSVAQLLRGGDHGPAIVAGNAEASILAKKLSSAPPFGDRMPQGGPYLPDSTQSVIRAWINQGANDN
jgi:hypothetical protein